MILTAHGASIYVEQHGVGDVNILLLHGWGCSTELWKPVTEHLSKRARVTVLDFAGHGRSSRPPVPWGTEDFMQMTVEIIEALGIEGCDVIGHSHGGRVALALAAEHPELIGRLVLTGAAGLHAEPTPEKQRRASTYKRLRGISDALDRVKILGPLPEKFREKLRQKYGSPDYAALDAEMRQTFVKVIAYDVADTLPRVKASTLLLWGSEDEETPMWMGQMMANIIPDAGLAVLQGGGHYAYLERLGDFLHIVEHFLLGGPA